MEYIAKIQDKIGEGKSEQTITDKYILGVIEIAKDRYDNEIEIVKYIETVSISVLETQKTMLLNELAEIDAKLNAIKELK